MGTSFYGQWCARQGVYHTFISALEIKDKTWDLRDLLRRIVAFFHFHFIQDIKQEGKFSLSVFQMCSEFASLLFRTTASSSWFELIWWSNHSPSPSECHNPGTHSLLAILLILPHNHQWHVSNLGKWTGTGLGNLAAYQLPLCILYGEEASPFPVYCSHIAFT